MPAKPKRQVILIARRNGDDESLLWNYDLLPGETDEAAVERATQLVRHELLGKDYTPANDDEKPKTLVWVNQALCADNVNILHEYY